MTERTEPSWWPVARQYRADGMSLTRIAAIFRVDRKTVWLACGDEAARERNRMVASAWAKNNPDQHRQSALASYHRRKELRT